MSASFTPMRNLPAPAGYKKGDVLVLFGELFSRGYANGIVDEAERHGLRVIRSTVGRRSEGQLRPLTNEEISAMNLPSGAKLINVPLEAGFDLEPCSAGPTPVDQLKGIKMSDWESVSLDWGKMEDSRRLARQRFRTNVESYLGELAQALKEEIAKGHNVIFAHLMAGGVPRAKILMPTMNWIFKGTGERHLASERFWKSDLGKFCAMSFSEVTADTLRVLIELSSTVRSQVEKNGGRVSYLAFGYHGTEVLINGEYAWQSYAPYLQGWAKVELEEIASRASREGIKATVYNCPEILTNSSSIFAGVEVPLYPFLRALKKTAPQAKQTTEITARCQALLKPDVTIDAMLDFANRALASKELQSVCNFAKWPGHNNQAQMDLLIDSANKLVEMHRDPKDLITFVLSEQIFRATGYLMFHDVWTAKEPVSWLGHDILAKALTSGQTL